MRARAPWGSPALILVAGLAAVGCGDGDPERLYLFDVHLGPPPSALESDEIVVAVGTTSWASASLLDADDRPLTGVLELRSADPEVLLVETGPAAFFFTGVRVGQASVEVTLDGERTVTVPARVAAQVAPAPGE